MISSKGIMRNDLLCSDLIFLAFLTIVCYPTFCFFLLSLSLFLICSRLCLVCSLPIFVLAFLGLFIFFEV